MSVKRSVHSSGLRIVTEEVPSVRSAAIGIWVNVGSREKHQQLLVLHHVNQR